MDDYSSVIVKHIKSSNCVTYIVNSQFSQYSTREPLELTRSIFLYS